MSVIDEAGASCLGARIVTSIIEFVKGTTEPANPKFVSPETWIATFDQDGNFGN